MQLDGVRIEPQAFAQGLDCFVVLCFVVELMCTFVVVVGAQERFRHRTGLRGRLCYDKKPRAASQATDGGYLTRRCPPPHTRSRTAPYPHPEDSTPLPGSPRRAGRTPPGPS